jgi:beta-galactosidase GanA
VFENLFASCWKNAFSNYAPEWVLSDTKRFPRSISADGLPLEILSSLGQETARCDSVAFTALMRHIHTEDATQNTVLMVQVENEIGYLGIGGRDRSKEANRLFQGPVPVQLSHALETRRTAHQAVAYFNPAGHTWKEMFGTAADEVFMAWHYGLFANQVAEAGKKELGYPCT